MLTLRRKIYLIYVPVIVILVAVSGWGVYSLVRLGTAVHVILVDNYKSIMAATSMKQELERENSSALLYLAGDRDKAVAQYNNSSQAFRSQLQIATGNITEVGEDKIVADITSQYSDYDQAVKRLVSSIEPAGVASSRSSEYFQQIEPRASSLEARLDDLLKINQDALFRTKDRAANRSFRAQVSTGVLATAGLLLSLLFAWRFVGYVVNPVTALAQKARLIGEGDYSQQVDIISHDEIGVLASEFNRMTARLRDLQRSDYARLLMAKKKSDAIINCIRDPVIVTDSLGTVVKLNDAAVSLIGDWTAKINDESAESTEKGKESRRSDAGLRILRIIHDSVAAGRPVSDKHKELLVPVSIDGDERNYRLRTAPMRDEDGRLLGSVTLLEDASALVDAERIKGEFISVAAETLKSPLASLRLALYTLTEGHLGELSEKQGEMLLVVRDDAERLDEIVRDLVEIAALDSGARSLNIEPVRPVDLARAAVARHQPNAEANRVALHNKVWSDMPRVYADRDAMKLVFDNLLSNAIRHTPHEGEVTVEAWERNNLVFFSIKDTGEGIPEEYLSSLFTSFTRIPGRKSGTTGLGLALVKRLVDAQDGQISVESKTGEGTTITFALPAEQAGTTPV